MISQNLIPNPGFETVTPTSSCERPDVAFVNLEQWYLLSATPDFFAGDCMYDEEEFIFWDESIRAAEGDNFVGIWSRWNSDETYKTEGIAIELTEELVAGQTYKFEFKIINQGEFQGLTSSCILMPDKHIDIYLSSDSIKIENDFSNGTASTTAERVAIVNPQEVTADATEDWTTVSTCFTAQGGEKFLGIVLPLGDFGNLPSCAASMGTSGVFRSFYYLLDDLNLTAFSTNLLRDTIMICEGQDFAADLYSIFDDGIFDQATFEWEDGSTDAFRVLDEAKDYPVDALTNCGTIPLSLSITQESCLSDFYVPNVFDPSADDINNTFLPMNIEEDKITNYRFNIFDRWGSQIFSSTDPRRGWDGRSQNKMLPPGNYVWQVSFDTIELNEQVQKSKQGMLVLVK